MRIISQIGKDCACSMCAVIKTMEWAVIDDRVSLGLMIEIADHVSDVCDEVIHGNMKVDEAKEQLEEYYTTIKKEKLQ